MSVADIVRLDSACVLDERTDVAPEKRIDGDPVQWLHNAYSDPDKRFHVGIWEGGVARWRVTYTEHEFCHILAGRLRLSDALGGAVEFGAGDSFVIPAGFNGIWESLERTRKIYVIYEPANIS